MGILRGHEVMVSSGHLPPSQGVKMSVGGENEASAEKGKRAKT